MEQKNYSTREKKWKQIIERERYQIEALLKAGQKIKKIAEQLGYSRRTIEREISKGKVEQLVRYASPNREKGDMGTKLVYCADTARCGMMKRHRSREGIRKSDQITS